MNRNIVGEEQAKWSSDAFNLIVGNISNAIVGKRPIIEYVFATMIAGGHVLLEDVPGTGKTALARELAKAVSGEQSRIQFTPDLLPGDITGINVYDQKRGEFVFHKGPIFANIVLADEINRASPKTQSALLEVMEERNVTVDGVSHAVGDSFTVIATQNPVEQAGTYRLPEAQLDRFMIKSSIGRVDRANLAQILSGHALQENKSNLINLEQLQQMRSFASAVYLSDAISGYIADLIEASHSMAGVRLGVSVRGALALVQLAKAWALVHGRTFVTAEDIAVLVPLVFCHRILLEDEAEFDGLTPELVVNTLLQHVPAPQGA